MGVFYILTVARWSFIALLSVVGGVFFGFALAMTAFSFGFGDLFPNFLHASWDTVFAFSWGVLSIAMCALIGWAANQQIGRPSLPWRRAEAKAAKRAPGEVLFPASFHDAARKNEALREAVIEAIVRCSSNLNPDQYSEDEAIAIAKNAVAGVMNKTWSIRKDTAKTILLWDDILGDQGLSWKIAARVAAIK